MIVYRGAINPVTVNFVTNMTLEHQRNLIFFDPRRESTTALERCYYWWRNHSNIVRPSILIREINQQLRLVSGAMAWLALGARSTPVNIEVWTEKTWPLPETLCVEHYVPELSLDMIEQNRARFNYLENSIKIKKHQSQLKLQLHQNTVKGLVCMGHGARVETVYYRDNIMATLNTAFNLADAMNF